MYSKEKDVLVRDKKLFTGYFIMTKSNRSYTIIDNDYEAKQAIDKLLEDGAEIYDSLEDFFLKYPPLTSTERMEIGEKFLEKNSDNL